MTGRDLIGIAKTGSEKTNVVFVADVSSCDGSGGGE